MKRLLPLLCGAVLSLHAPRLFAQAPPAAVADFNAYAAQLELHLGRQPTREDFPSIASADRARLRDGAVHAEQLPAPLVANALIHHWRATLFVPGATAAAFQSLLRDVSAYPHNFAPDIVASTTLARTPTHTLLRLRTRQRHILTVVLDTTCDVSFAPAAVSTSTGMPLADTDSSGYSLSRCAYVDQIAPAPASPAGNDGFLYRLNTYWSWQQHDGGLYLQLESLSLTRSIPRGLAWVVQPFLESVPRDSLVFTLTSARNALRR